MTTVFRHSPIVLATAITMLTMVSSAAQRSAQPERDATPTGTKFERFFTQDKFGRRITFYVSAASGQGAGSPLVVFVQGSGCTSQFVRRGDQVYGGLQNLVLQKAENRARVLVVEKPGVTFLDTNDRPGSGEKCSPAFLAEHTLDRWGEAVSASLKAAWQLPGIDARQTLIVGHSEGGIVAARVAAENEQVTHVASLAGGGPTQLFDLAELARQTAKPEERAARDPGESVYDAWRTIEADPDSVTKFFMGHPYRRWSSFLKTSVLTELLRSHARVYLAHGTRDQAVTVSGFDVLRAELAARGRQVTVERVEGADHGFVRGPEDQEGIRTIFGHVMQWFLAG